MIRTDLGIVTAYAEAVSKGYTGTREDFGDYDETQKGGRLNGICPEFSVFLHHFVDVFGDYLFCNEWQNCKVYSCGYGHGSPDSFTGNPFFCGGDR